MHENRIVLLQKAEGFYFFKSIERKCDIENISKGTNEISPIQLE